MILYFLNICFHLHFNTFNGRISRIVNIIFSLIGMRLDKSWMKIIDRTQLVYEKGVIDFIEVAFIDLEEGKLI